LDNTQASFIFPASHGRGLCSYALSCYLIETHNSLVKSDLPAIVPTKATLAHLAALTSVQLQSLLLAHTRHSFEANGALREHYDIEAIERKVKERFVRGRPRMMGNELPRILYLEDRIGIQHKELSTKVVQELVINSRQHQLEMELKMLPDLCKLLDSLHTAREFLLETGGDPSHDLPAFLGRLRLYRDEGDQKNGGPLRGLKLCHLDALINFLLFVRAKRMIHNRQNVFEQVIPLAYRKAMPVGMEDLCKETLTRVNHTWILPELFRMIWLRLREEPLGDTSGTPAWPLKVMLAPHVETGEELCDQLPEELLVEHSVSFFLGLLDVIYKVI